MAFRRALACVFAGALPLCQLVGCANPDSAVGFHEPSGNARIRAIRAAGERNDRSAIPDLIAELEADDPAERLLALRTLERLTGQTLDYDHAAPPEARRAAALRWAEWYSQQGESPKVEGQGKGRSVGGRT